MGCSSAHASYSMVSTHVAAGPLSAECALLCLHPPYMQQVSSRHWDHSEAAYSLVIKSDYQS